MAGISSRGAIILLSDRLCNQIYMRCPAAHRFLVTTSCSAVVCPKTSTSKLNQPQCSIAANSPHAKACRSSRSPIFALTAFWPGLRPSCAQHDGVPVLLCCVVGNKFSRFPAHAERISAGAGLMISRKYGCGGRPQFVATHHIYRCTIVRFFALYICGVGSALISNSTYR